MMTDPLASLGKSAREWTAGVNPWTNVYGLARTMLATATAATLAFSHSTSLFQLRPTGCAGPGRIGLFCLFADHLELARWIAVGLLLLAASGWRPRVTGLLHWWVSFSFQAAAATLDGGDQVTAVLTLLLAPVALTDTRRWHWQIDDRPRGRAEQRLLALSALTLARIQVAAIYLVAAVTKLRVEEWTDGTALYYYFHHPSDGASPWVLPWLAPLLSHGTVVAALSWGTLGLELFLFASLVMDRRMRTRLLAPALAFHAGIAAILGILTFALTMMAALVVLLHPIERRFRFSGSTPLSDGTRALQV